jgi:hypothetical protein
LIQAGGIGISKANVARTGVKFPVRGHLPLARKRVATQKVEALADPGVNKNWRQTGVLQGGSLTAQKSERLQEDETTKPQLNHHSTKPQKLPPTSPSLPHI